MPDDDYGHKSDVTKIIIRTVLWFALAYAAILGLAYAAEHDKSHPSPTPSATARP
jgi:hypothetical protein